MKLLICTPFPNQPTDTQLTLLKQLEANILTLALALDLVWFICSDADLMQQRLSRSYGKISFIIQDPTDDSMVLKRRYLLAEAINAAEENGFNWDLLVWMDADDLPTTDYKAALKYALDSPAYLSCLHGQLKNKTLFENYTKYQAWLRTNANEALTRGENPFSSGSCLVWKSTTPKELLLGESVDTKYAGVEDVCWAYYARKNAIKVPVQGAVLVRPSTSYDFSYEKIIVRRDLIRDFYKQNGYKAYNQIGYSNEL